MHDLGQVTPSTVRVVMVPAVQGCEDDVRLTSPSPMFVRISEFLLLTPGFSSSFLPDPSLFFLG